MKVILLLQVAVLVSAGSYPMSPESSDETLIWRRSAVRMAPFSMGSSYCLPVRLSVIVRVSCVAMAAVSSPGIMPSTTSADNARHWMSVIRAALREVEQQQLGLAR